MFIVVLLLVTNNILVLIAETQSPTVVSLTGSLCLHMSSETKRQVTERNCTITMSYIASGIREF